MDVQIDHETVWLTQAQMVVLFGRNQSVISRHINNIFKEGELDKNSVYAKIAYTATDGKLYDVDHFNLDVIISVGYRVKSQQGTRFRQWANGVLKEYLLRGYAINQHIQRIENFVLEMGRRVTITEYEIANIRGYIESFLADQNDINEDTRTHIELINKSLAALEVQHKEQNKPRMPIGFRKD